MSSKLKSTVISLRGLNQRINELKPSDWDSLLPKFGSLLKETNKLTEQLICEVKRAYQPTEAEACRVANRINASEGFLLTNQIYYYCQLPEGRCRKTRRNLGISIRKSRATVHNYLKKLEAESLIIRVPEKVRGYKNSVIRLTPLGEMVSEILLVRYRTSQRTKKQITELNERAKDDIRHKQGDGLIPMSSVISGIEWGIGQGIERSSDAELLPYLNDREKDLLGFPKWRNIILNRAKLKMAEAKANEGNSP